MKEKPRSLFVCALVLFSAVVLALAVEKHEEWIEGTRYLNMDLLKEHKKKQLLDAKAPTA